MLQAAELIMQLLPAVFQAMSTVQADTGKPWEEVAEDVIKHLTPGQPNSPSLSPEVK